MAAGRRHGKERNLETVDVSLDLFGTVLITLGLVELFAGLLLVPEALRFPYYGPALIAAGVVLSIPFAADVIRHVRRVRAADTH
ncbi:hypothetical protein [Thioalkalivibrio sp. ALR17-21]|uniref:hypothetical protein n=1 Tax=Thioalkalivibrio sp. ALR17-21 TaxID=1269813 RepID=UPI0012DC06D7|nr:hypothetical protein [Thioalkalivibrio sp. ALR17-21]